MSTFSLSADLAMARSYLEQHPDVKVVGAKDNRLVGRESGQGIVPLLQLADRLGSQLVGASVADRVIGRAAGFILVQAQVASVYAQILSTEAEALLHSHGVAVFGGKRVPYIQKPDGSSRCVMEQEVLGLDDPHEAVDRLRQFLSARRVTR